VLDLIDELERVGELAVELDLDVDDPAEAAQLVLDAIGSMVLDDALGAERAVRCEPSPEQCRVLARTHRDEDALLDAYVATAEWNERHAVPAPAAPPRAPMMVLRRQPHRRGRGPSGRPAARAARRGDDSGDSDSGSSDSDSDEPAPGGLFGLPRSGVPP
jgi:hypothetical protein